MPITSLLEAHTAIASLSENANALVKRLNAASAVKLDQLYRHHNTVGTTGDTLVVLQMLEYAARGDYKFVEWMVTAILKDRNK